MQLIEQGVLKPQEMSKQIFDKLESQLFPHLERIQFGGNNFGEPLLASSWDTFFERVSKLKIRISLVSNGKLLTRGRIRAMVDAGVEFNFSLEGATPETYEKIRGYKFAEFVGIVRGTCREKVKADTGVHVNFGFTACRDNICEIQRLVTMAGQLGVDRITVTHFVPWHENQRQQSLVYHKELSNKMLNIVKQMARESGLLIDLPQPFRLDDDSDQADCPRDTESSIILPCSHPWTSVSINEQGDVMPCCATSVVMGNLNDASFHNIWNGPRYLKLRKSVNSSQPLNFCRDCGLRAIEIGSNKGLSFCSDEKILLSAIGTKAGSRSPGLRNVRNALLKSRWGRKLVPFLTELHRRHIAFYR